jgi:hypothetical protein
MSNLAQTQAEWTRLFRELGFMLGVDKYLDDVARKFDSLRNRVQVVEENSVNAFTNTWTLSGVVFGTNTDESGLLYVRITKDSTSTTIASGSNTVNVSTFAGSGTLHAVSTAGFPTSGTLSVVTGSGVRVVSYTGVSGNDFTGCSCSSTGVLSTGGAITVSTVALYKAAGGGGTDLMAQGIAAYATTFALTAQNSSGLSGSVVVATLSGSESDDKHRLRLFPDFLVRARSIFDGTKPEHGALLGSIISTFSRMQASIVGAQNQWQTVLNSFTADRMANFLGSSQKSPVTQGTSNSNGAITLVTTGILEDLRADMVDETTAGAQKVVKNVVTSAAPVADAHNTGRLFWLALDPDNGRVGLGRDDHARLHGRDAWGCQVHRLAADQHDEPDDPGEEPAPGRSRVRGPRPRDRGHDVDAHLRARRGLHERLRLGRHVDAHGLQQLEHRGRHHLPLGRGRSQQRGALQDRGLLRRRAHEAGLLHGLCGGGGDRHDLRNQHRDGPLRDRGARKRADRRAHRDPGPPAVRDSEQRHPGRARQVHDRRDRHLDRRDPAAGCRVLQLCPELGDERVRDPERGLCSAGTIPPYSVTDA